MFLPPSWSNHLESDMTQCPQQKQTDLAITVDMPIYWFLAASYSSSLPRQSALGLAKLIVEICTHIFLDAGVTKIG